MKPVKKSVLLWYSPREMYELVTHIEAYPEFLPWCAAAQVLERHEGGLTARLDMAFAGVRTQFTTRNLHEANQRVRVALVEGPFAHLEGDWHFKPLSRPGSAPDEVNACKINFEMSYRFEHGALDAVLSPVFDKVAETLVDRFVARAEQLYGPR
ncbi:MAG: type II toxin-antitoxin system RatA family toxin [Burkholderiales bacterium]|jgi:ribosome-associated toxin RatA of RatAB toxin-antitoxin module